MERLINYIMSLFGANSEEEEPVIINKNGHMELVNRGKKAYDKWEIENNLENMTVCVYDFEDEELKEYLRNMRYRKITEYFKPVVVNYLYKDEEKKYPIYHYLKSDVNVLKNIILEKNKKNL